jgi:hypothetical protein
MAIGYEINRFSSNMNTIRMREHGLLYFFRYKDNFKKQRQIRSIMSLKDNAREIPRTPGVESQSDPMTSGQSQRLV